MPVTIHYCKTCGFLKPAQAIADALETQHGLKSDLRKGFWGTFRIEYEGEVIYNRWQTRGWLGRLGFGHTATAEEVVHLFNSRLNGRNGQ